MKRLISVGECMLELSPNGNLWRMNVAGDTFNTAWYARRLLPADWEVGYVTRLGGDAFSDGWQRSSRPVACGFMARDIRPGLSGCMRSS